jgi:lysophospholipase L1-like esterase
VTDSERPPHGDDRGPRRAWHVLAVSVAIGVVLAGMWASTSKASASALVRVIQPRPSAAPSVTPALPPQRIVVLGDSVAAGTGCGCTGFADLLASDAAARSHQASTLSNLALDGLTTSRLLAQLSDPTTAQRLREATLVTVTISANDFDGELAVTTACGGAANLGCYSQGLTALPGMLGSVLTRIHALAPPGARVLVTGYWNVFLDGDVGSQLGRTYVETSDALTRRVNTVLAATARNSGATYVDLYAAFGVAPRAIRTALLAPDGDHPSAAGHQLIADALASAAGLT